MHTYMHIYVNIYIYIFIFTYTHMHMYSCRGLWQAQGGVIYYSFLNCFAFCFLAATGLFAAINAPLGRSSWTKQLPGSTDL